MRKRRVWAAAQARGLLPRPDALWPSSGLEAALTEPWGTSLTPSLGLRAHLKRGGADGSFQDVVRIQCERG